MTSREDRARIEKETNNCNMETHSRQQAFGGQACVAMLAGVPLNEIVNINAPSNLRLANFKKNSGLDKDIR